MRLRLVLVVLALMVVGGAGVALAAHPTADPATVPRGFLAAHVKVNNIPLATLERALRSKKADLFIEHGHLDPNQATAFSTHPGPTFYVVVSGAVINENVSGGECRRKTYAKGLGFVERNGGRGHRLTGGAAGADYYAVSMHPRNTGPDRRQVNPPGECR
jgi:hypothetical protein